MNLVLIGYRGTGKSTLGKLLAERLGLSYVCLDDQIVKRAGMSIPRIVERHGWDYFRDLEEEVVREASQGDRQLIDAGGGVITREANIENLRRNGLVVLLEATVEDIVARIGSDTQRPSLTGTKSFTEEVEEVLQQRRPLYEKAAHHCVNTSELSVEEAVDRIAQLFVNVAGT